MFWPRTPAAPDAVATAASAPEPARAASQAPPPELPARPESVITTVVVDPLQPTLTPPSKADSGPPVAGVAAAATVPAPPALSTVVRESPKPGAVAALPPAAPAKAKPEKTPAPALEPNLQVRGSPNIQCAGLNPVMQVVCVERACKRPELRDHVDCGDLPSETRRD